MGETNFNLSVAFHNLEHNLNIVIMLTDLINEELWQTLKRYATRLTSDKYLAEDLVQDTLERSLMNEDKFDENQELLPWLCTIMKHLWLNSLRREECDDIENFDVEGEDGNVEYNDLVRQINSVLSDDDKEIFWLWYEGYGGKEISTKVGIPVGTVKNKVWRIREKLKKEILQKFQLGGEASLLNERYIKYK